MPGRHRFEQVQSPQRGDMGSRSVFPSILVEGAPYNKCLTPSNVSDLNIDERKEFLSIEPCWVPVNFIRSSVVVGFGAKLFFAVWVGHPLEWKLTMILKLMIQRHILSHQLVRARVHVRTEQPQSFQNIYICKEHVGSLTYFPYECLLSLLLDETPNLQNRNHINSIVALYTSSFKMKLLSIVCLATFGSIAAALPSVLDTPADSAAQLEKRASVASCAVSGGGNIPVCCANRTPPLGDRRTNCRDGT